MAKSKSFFGMRTGSTKSLTFSILRGQQITKDRVSKVSNPQNLNQGMIRSMFSAASKFYAKCRFILDHSWEGVDYGTPSQAEFMKRAIATRYGTSLAKGEAAMPFNYQVSSGSLPSVTVGPVIGGGGVLTGSLLTSLRVPEEDDIDFTTKLRSLNGLEVGDNITLLGWTGNNNAFAVTFTLPDDKKQTDSDSFYPSRIQGQVSEYNDPRWSSMFSSVEGGDSFTYASAGRGHLLNGAVILSRQDSTGKWLRSSESFTMLNVDTTSIEGALSFTKAGAGVSIESDWQLNEDEHNEVTQEMQLLIAKTIQVPDPENPESTNRLYLTANIMTQVEVGQDGKPIIYQTSQSYEGQTIYQLVVKRRGELARLQWSAEELQGLGLTITETDLVVTPQQLTNNQFFTIESVDPSVVANSVITLGLANVIKEA